MEREGTRIEAHGTESIWKWGLGKGCAHLGKSENVLFWVSRIEMRILVHSPAHVCFCTVIRQDPDLHYAWLV